MKIRAAVLEEMGRPTPYATTLPMVVQEVDLEAPGPGEVQIRIVSAGICHSDLSVLEGNRSRPMPIVLGHEASGIVEALGAGVDDLREGDHVVTIFVATCGHCQPCAEGRPALCEPGGAAGTDGTLLHGAVRLSRAGARLHHHAGVSAFATHATLSRCSLIKIDKDLKLEEAALFGCAVLTGVGAVTNASSISLGSSVAVIGLGGVGLAGLLGTLAAGASRVVAIDTNDEKLAFARQLGATETYNATHEGIVETVRDLTRGGVDVVLEFAGSGKALELGYKLARRGGELVTAGLPNPSVMFSIPAVTLTAEERTIRGSYLGTSVPVRDIPRYIELYRRGKLPVDRLVTHRLPLEEINLGMDRLRDGKAVRQMIQM